MPTRLALTYNSEPSSGLQDSFLSSRVLTFTSLQNIYYGCLYAYTPEVLPSAHRGTGNGISIGLNRIMGIMSAVIATFVHLYLLCSLRAY